MGRSRALHLIVWLLAAVVLAACGGNPATQVPPATLAVTPSPTPMPTPIPTPTLTADELARYRPNELGQVWVLMYHGIVEEGGAYDRTPDKLRADLKWLYEHDFYVIPARDYLTDEIAAPAGKRPVVLTFDDGVVSQFNYIVNPDGTKTLDPDCAVAILEDAFARYPGFGRGGLFSILPMAPFAWPDAPDQLEYAGEKLRWLLDHGYEIGNHTIGHVDLSGLTDEEIRQELGGAVDMIHDDVPDAAVEVIALPFGMYPPRGDDSLLRGFTRGGTDYRFLGALMVGANPAPSPAHQDFDPFWTPRIWASDEELDKWFAFADDYPGILYVSDGNPATVTIPETVHAWLDGTLDESKVAGKTIIRYGD